MGEFEKATALVIKPGAKSYLFWGPPGVGKTTLATMIPGKGFLIDVDQKIEEQSNIKPEDRERIQVWVPHETLSDPGKILIPWSPDAGKVQVGTKPTQEPRGYRRTVALVNELLMLAQKPEAFPFEWCVVDSLTAVSEHWKSLIMYTHGVTFMTERLWGVYLQGMKEFVNGFLQLPCIRVVIAHEKRNTDDNTKIEIVRPAIEGQYGNNLAREFSEAWYFKGRTHDGKYQIQTVSDWQITARTTKGLKPIEDINATLFA